MKTIRLNPETTILAVVGEAGVLCYLPVALHGSARACYAALAPYASAVGGELQLISRGDPPKAPAARHKPGAPGWHRLPNQCQEPPATAGSLQRPNESASAWRFPNLRAPSGGAKGPGPASLN